jgi:hypothetical protein
MLASPGVSICIPVHGAPRTLAETVRSVLEQTYRDFELVLVDDAPADGSDRIARSFRDPRVRVEPAPAGAAELEHWGRAVARCRAPLVKLVRADDLLHPRCLEYQVGPMEADAGLALVAGRRHLVDERTRVLLPRRGLTGLTGVRSSVEVARQVVRHGADVIGEPCAVLFRRDHYDAAGGWPAQRPHVAAPDLWMRLLQYGEFLGLPETLAAVRVRRDRPPAAAAAARAQERELVGELAGSPYFAVRALDRGLGTVLGPFRRRARRGLQRAVRRHARRDERLGSAGPEAAGPGN